MKRCARDFVETARALPWLVLTATARAAGGHFDVDDAVVLAPGHCQYEVWMTRSPSSSSAAPATLFHLGPGCRVGPVEVGVNYERFSVGKLTASSTQSTVGPQLKWVAAPVVEKLNVGIAWNAAFDVQHGGRPAQSLYVPVTWAASPSIAVNANIGADSDFAGQRTSRMGVSGEWAVDPRATMFGERGKFSGSWTSRLGTRFMLTDRISLDLSVARVGPNATRLYAIGLNQDFSR